MISTWARLCITNGIFLIVLISFSLRNNHRAEAATNFRHSGKSFIPSLAQDVKIAFASCMQQAINISTWYNFCIWFDDIEEDTTALLHTQTQLHI